MLAIVVDGSFFSGVDHPGRVRCDWWCGWEGREGAGAAPYGKWYGALLPFEDGTERFSLTSSMGVPISPVVFYNLSSQASTPC